MTKYLFILLAFFISIYSFAQIKGTVTDNKNLPLPFVNIYIENTFTGTTSNTEGNYELNISKTGSYTVIFQFLGYKTIKKVVDIQAFPYVLDASMFEEEISLNEVVINSDENPADKIIKKAIEFRKVNLEKIKGFNATFYSRGLLRIKNAPEKFLGQDLDEFMVGLDSTRSGILYLSETISAISYKRPDKLKEQIIASKVSGDSNGFSFNTANDMDFNFYANTIELGNQIVSPIADYAFSYYRYKLEGVFYDNRGNLINKIKVIPRRINDRIFAGTIYIVENQWTIYALELAITGEQAQIPPADLITITQNFSYSENNTLWYLMSQSIDFEYGLFGFKGDGRYTAVYSDYEFNPEFAKKTFTNEIVSFADEANKKDSTYWNTLRPVPLTDEEINDYLKKDSIQIVRKSKTYLDSMDHKKNKFKLGNILSGYNYSNSYENWNTGITSPITALSFNTVQGWNAKIDGYYRKNYDEFKRFLSINGTLNYGFSDERLRGTIGATYKFNNISKPYLSVSGGITTQQFNENLRLLELLNGSYSLFSEKNYMKIYDKSFVQVDYSQEVFNGLRLHSDLSYQRRQALFNTTDQAWYPKTSRDYTSNNPLDETAYGIAPFETHNIVKLNLNAQINFDQEYLSYPDSKFNIPSSKYPTLYLGYEKGLVSSVSDYNFDQVKARITQSFDVGNIGNFKYNVKAGTFFNADAIAFMDYYHPNGNQTNIGSDSSYLNVFNNLPYYAMSTNKSYMEFHAEHDFKGYILGKIPLLNKLNYNLVIGAHSLTTTDNKPYQEFSVGIDNIGFGKIRLFRFDYVRSYQNGFQGDAFIFGLKILNIIN